MSKKQSVFPAQVCSLYSTSGEIYYILERKHIKNLNIRIGTDGVIKVSAPVQIPLSHIEKFLREKSGWIYKHLNSRMDTVAVPLPDVPEQVCFEMLREALERVYPLVQPMGVQFPRLKVKHLRSQWGNCHWARQYITLNAALARCPESLRDYVALHELVHFLYHDHGPGFYAQMDMLMPDWRKRRGELKAFGAILIS